MFVIILIVNLKEVKRWSKKNRIFNRKVDLRGNLWLRKAKGEFLLTQNGKILSGKIIFFENVEDEEIFMI